MVIAALFVFPAGLLVAYLIGLRRAPAGPRRRAFALVGAVVVLVPFAVILAAVTLATGE
jgi:hypothetical protein